VSDHGQQRVFITGASGFIGRTLAAHYRSEGWNVTGVDAVASEDGAVVAGDIATPGPWQDHVDGAQLVIHTAAVVSNTASRDRCWEVNVLGTRRASTRPPDGEMPTRWFRRMSSLVPSMI